MRTESIHRILILILILICGCLAATVFAARPGDPDAAPAVQRAEEVARQYVANHLDELGLQAADVREMRLRDGYRSPRTGVVHLHFQQRWSGLDVAGALLSVHVDGDGAVRHLGNRFVADLESAVDPREPVLTPSEAYGAAFHALGLKAGARSAPVRVTGAGDDPGDRRFAGGALSQDDVPVRLSLVRRDDGRVVPAWELVVRTHDHRHWLNVWLSTEDGSLVRYHDWVGRLDADGATAPATGSTAREYKVFARPAMNPEDEARSLVQEPVGSVASPFGWHDTDGKAGVDYDDTRGNNAYVQTESGYRASLSGGKSFGPALDLTKDPSTYTDAALVNTFYWMNALHDLHYRFGFDEAAGNFQQNNYGRGGLAGDPVMAVSQTDAMITFATPPDGTAPVSQLFIATPITALIPMEHSLTLSPGDGVSLEPLSAAGAYFGPILDRRGVRAPLVRALDPVAGEADGAAGGARIGSRRDGCQPFLNGDDMLGKVALVEAGPCRAVDQARHAQEAGAVGLVVVAPPGRELQTLGSHAEGGDVEIPVITVRADDLETLGAVLEAGVEAQLSSSNELVMRDADLDSTVLIHEYGHGVANRLVGGPTSVGCLQDKQSMGIVEGVGDVWSLAFTARSEHAGETPRAMATYVFFQPSDGGGVRGVPYSTDLAVNPFTYGDLASFHDGAMVPHAAGTRWAALLWEVYWKLVAEQGFTSDLMNGSGGNVVFLELLTDSLKLMPCNPTFIEARDAFLAADVVAHGGANACSIWRGFARRGLGVGATDGGGADQLAVVESYDLPAECQGLAVDSVRSAADAGEDGSASAAEATGR